jgi:hypothetical protein
MATSSLRLNSKLYETYLVPLIFESYAEEMARRIAPFASRVLEIAAGTGRDPCAGDRFAGKCLDCRDGSE